MSESVEHSSISQGTSSSKCIFPWDSMEGSMQVRNCPICQTKVYRIDGLDKKQILELVQNTEPTTDIAKLTFYKRKDGTLTSTAGGCSKVNWNVALGVMALDLWIYGLTFFAVPDNLQLMQWLCVIIVIMGVFGHVCNEVLVRLFKVKSLAFWLLYAAAMGITIMFLGRSHWEINRLFFTVLVPLFIPIHGWLAAKTAANNMSTPGYLAQVQFLQWLRSSRGKQLSIFVIIAITLFSCIDWVASGANLSCMKITWGYADTKNLRAVIDKELQPAEKILWCGYPSTDWYNHHTGIYVVQMLAGIGLCFMLSLAIRSTFGKNINEGLYKLQLSDLLSALIGGIFLLVYMISIWPDAVYAITSQRIIAVRFNRVHQLSIKQLENYSLIKHDDDTTDVVIRQAKPSCYIIFGKLTQRDAEGSIEPLLKKLLPKT